MGVLLPPFYLQEPHFLLEQQDLKAKNIIKIIMLNVSNEIGSPIEWRLKQEEYEENEDLF